MTTIVHTCDRCITGLNAAQSIPIEELLRRYHCHPQLVNALERLLPSWDDDPTQPDGSACCEISYGDVRAIRAALAAARPGVAQPECGVAGIVVDGVKLP